MSLFEIVVRAMADLPGAPLVGISAKEVSAW